MRYDLEQSIEHEIRALARKHRVRTVRLFGSRARGDNGVRSDIDLAVSGGNIAAFSLDVDEKTSTLLRFDIVNLDRGISAALRARIDRDGIVLYDEGRARLMDKYDHFMKCLGILQKADKKQFADELYRMGVIGQFNLTFELAWKSLQAALRLHGAERTGSPREIFKTAYSVGFLPDDAIWLDMLEKRNRAAHVYDEGEADKLAALIFDAYVPAFAELGTIIRKKINEA